MQTATAETRVDRDREYDQTAKTEPTPEDFARPMPPVIEQHNSRLAKPVEQPVFSVPVESSYLNVVFHRLWTKAVGTPDYDKSEWTMLGDLIRGKCEELEKSEGGREIAMRRVREFERLTHNLAEKLDAIICDIEFVTGQPLEELVIDARAERAKLAPTDLCRSDLGGGMVCLLNGGHDGQCNANPQPPPVSAFNVAELGQCEFSEFTQKGIGLMTLNRCQLIEGHTGGHMF